MSETEHQQLSRNRSKIEVKTNEVNEVNEVFKPFQNISNIHRTRIVNAQIHARPAQSPSHNQRSHALWGKLRLLWWTLKDSKTPLFEAASPSLLSVVTQTTCGDRDAVTLLDAAGYIWGTQGINSVMPCPRSKQIEQDIATLYYYVTLCNHPRLACLSWNQACTNMIASDANLTRRGHTWPMDELCLQSIPEWFTHVLSQWSLSLDWFPSHLEVPVWWNVLSEANQKLIRKKPL